MGLDLEAQIETLRGCKIISVSASPRLNFSRCLARSQSSGVHTETWNKPPVFTRCRWGGAELLIRCARSSQRINHPLLLCARPLAPACSRVALPLARALAFGVAVRRRM